MGSLGETAAQQFRNRSRKTSPVGDWRGVDLTRRDGARNTGRNQRRTPSNRSIALGGARSPIGLSPTADRHVSATRSPGSAAHLCGLAVYGVRESSTRAAAGAEDSTPPFPHRLGRLPATSDPFCSTSACAHALVVDLRVGHGRRGDDDERARRHPMLTMRKSRHPLFRSKRPNAPSWTRRRKAVKCLSEPRRHGEERGHDSEC